MIPQQPSRQPQDELPVGHKPRRFGRLRCEMLRCPLGKVLDLSASGLRVEGKARQCPVEPDQQVWLALQGGFGELKLKASVVWTQQVARKRYRAGFEFVDLDDRTRAHLGEVARSTVQSYVIAHVDYDD